ncbi:unnamed protein product [Pseudo-nitzschia multistriata]|uniref:EF-hand domain-containing protein n=1 Tax=Pseudo-nitzschia multistriata TaxID=183589 RepID=A0A448ZEX0_9STRA|nr:unnamed protein product [Pseudo-nitzschia multistriata]
MSPIASILFFCIIYCASTVDARSVGSLVAPKPSSSKPRIFRSSINRFVDKLFQETDANNDGQISFEEAYIGCLMLYVQLNQSAPIPPPDRKKFRRIFSQAAAEGNKWNNKKNALDLEQYENMLKKLVARAVLRLTSHKIVTIAGAPLLAEMIVRSLAKRKKGFEELLRSIIPLQFQDATIPTLTSKAFHRGLWMVILVTTLGNIVLATVTQLLDMQLPKPKRK